MTTEIKDNEQQAAGAFSKQSAIFDKLYSGDAIIQYKRERVRQHISRFLTPESSILELNSGTGEDALWFAQHGYHVHATDISVGMQQQLIAKVRNADLENMVSTELCSFTNLENLVNRGPYDFIFSNFAGLNCTDQLEKVLHSFSKLLKPGGLVTLVILPKFCLWESLMMVRGKFKTATRRWFSSKGVTAHIEGEYFKCWYYDPATVKRFMKGYEYLGHEGLCTIVPPSYIEGFGEKYPQLFRTLRKKEDLWKKKWPWRNIGDYYIISFRKPL